MEEYIVTMWLVSVIRVYSERGTSIISLKSKLPS